MNWAEFAKALRPRATTVIGVVAERLVDGRSILTLLDGAQVSVVGDQFPTGTRVLAKDGRMWRKLPAGGQVDAWV